MLREIIKVLFALIVLTIPLASCASAQNSSNDLSSDAYVIAALQKIKDAKIKLTGDEKLDAKIKNARRLEARDVCIERLKETTKIIVIGFFRNDYGCHFEGAFVGSRYYEAMEIIELSKAALEELGWQKANRAEREKLARLWVEKGLIAFFTVLETQPEELESAGFRSPEVSTTENGDVKVTLWIRLPSGRTREKGFQYLEYRFKADGEFSGSSTLENVSTSN